ncbi:MAG: hypothetical protein ACD_30C00039G0012 [uncultured bacterium]|uniref:Uncharacterized protein n=2 Tax=Candidatus Daviesiibacteriota TaxID=1752718 RepID=A0A1F5K551_9BACT|nr:MAG: hypothetical protein ACD_30C00039G0012 [uncultured bacterium]OGE17109.1 MAG: hypothetical protein A2858_00185 [Candidatus Daviesbacteria bacterium RIFCSPHIGHO2_01_FULL_36_37]OGE31259.1 MAG: hypothetical protein A3C99_01270 [Candidatus Daviesbacteria bacterium RIFCSPHIGHO2_02_FULL_37_9]OGE35890.1 MAG: hypothetical protein A3E66_01180 [Candidatus Daviesbacteria bacterium RIFCSPHIGHO2_12_FULL_37_16]
MDDNKWRHVHTGGSGAVYGMGVIGSLFYFLQHSSSLQEVLLGLVYSFFWPAVLIYKAFELLGF